VSYLGVPNHDAGRLTLEANIPVRVKSYFL
jgi:hypothetical protein